MVSESDPRYDPFASNNNCTICMSDVDIIMFVGVRLGLFKRYKTMRETRLSHYEINGSGIARLRISSTNSVPWLRWLWSLRCTAM